MFENFSLMRTQKIDNVNDILKLYNEDELFVHEKIEGTLGIYFKINDKTCFKTRIGISFTNVPEMDENIPNNTVFLAIITQDNKITVVDILWYDEIQLYTEALYERMSYIEKIKEYVEVQEFKLLKDQKNIDNYIIKPKFSTYKITKQNSSEYNGDWFTIDNNTHDVIIKSYFTNGGKKFFRCFQIIEGRLKKVCNVSIEDEKINRKITKIVNNNKRAVITLTGLIKEEKIINPEFIKIKKNKPFNSVTSLKDRKFSTLEVITIGNKNKNKVISGLVDSYTTNRRLI